MLKRLLEEWYEEEVYPSEGDDLGPNVERVAFERLGSRRWGTDVRIVFRMGDEYVAVQDVEPGTEMQDWGDYGKPQIYPVRPVEKTIITYERVNNDST